MSPDALVSIGIPTYNRPQLLAKAIESVIKQTHKNLDIVISDNASPGDETREIVRHYIERDSRIRYFRQEKNLGQVLNHKFVLEKASGKYFMWLSDDNSFESNDLVEKLLEACEDRLLVFPDVNFIFEENGIVRNVLYGIYAHCRSDLDYLIAWCENGYGNPVHGLFNLERVKQARISLVFDSDLSYHNEGILLHRLFLHGNLAFVPEVSYNFDRIGGSAPDTLLHLQAHTTYTKRTLVTHLQSNLPFRSKMLVLLKVLTAYSLYEFQLVTTLWRDFSKTGTVAHLLANPMTAFLSVFSICHLLALQVFIKIKRMTRLHCINQ